MHPELQADYKKKSRPRLRQIEGRVRFLARKEQATTALKEIDRHLKRGVITTRQYDRMRSWIAASLYYQGYQATAKRHANAAAKRSGEAAVLSYWISGLIAFREGDVASANDYFSKMAAVPYQEDDLRAGAAFWAARTGLAAGKAAEITPNLELAANYPFTFYGQLALAQLGRDYAYHWDAPAVTKEGLHELTEKHPAVRRALALAQVGEKTKAETELRWVNGAIKGDLDYELLAVANALNLPAAQMDIALSGDADYLQSGLFPLPDYSPKGGFEADRAVLFAVMRQESKFKPEALSRAGARGLMQIMPRTASFVAKDGSLRRRKGRDRLHHRHPRRRA